VKNSALTFNWAIIVGAAAMAGALVAAVPWQASVALVVAAGVVGVLVFARLFLRAAPGTEESAERRLIEEREDARLRAPRYLFYLGAGTMGLLTVRPALALTLSDWIFFACLGLTCAALLVSRTDRDYLVPVTITVGVGLFAAGGLLSSFGAVAAQQSVSIVARLVYLTVVWFWLATILLQTREHVRNAAIAWVGSVALSSSGALLQYLYGDVIPGGDSAWGRMTGFTPHYNHLGGLVATAMAPALMLAVDASRRWVRITGLGTVAFLGAGLLLSGSVGGLLATVTAVVFWLVVRGVPFRTGARLVAVVIVGTALLVTTGASSVVDPLRRIERVTSAEEAAAGTGGSLYTRLEGYEEAWARIREQPLIGVGLDELSSQAVLGPKLVHNMLINQWFSGGILALVGIVVIIGGVALTGLRVVRSSVLEERAFSIALLGSVGAFVVFGMGEPILFVRYGWFPAALLIALDAQRRRREPATSPEKALVRPATVGRTPT
jgi:O-antigen ligase